MYLEYLFYIIINLIASSFICLFILKNKQVFNNNYIKLFK